jgi:hypothetical protein
MLDTDIGIYKEFQARQPCAGAKIDILEIQAVAFIKTSQLAVGLAPQKQKHSRHPIRPDQAVSIRGSWS